jgi:hypothetical protein
MKKLTLREIEEKLKDFVEVVPGDEGESVDYIDWEGMAKFVKSLIDVKPPACDRNEDKEWFSETC